MPREPAAAARSGAAGLPEPGSGVVLARPLRVNSGAAAASNRRAREAESDADRHLIQRAQAGDTRAFEELVADGVISEPSPRLRERLANVVVLPRYGEAVYWHEPGRFVQQLHGQHGGLSPQEMEIPLVAWVA